MQYYDITKLSSQQVFNLYAQHLLARKNREFNKRPPTYYNEENGAQCGAGIFISEAEYGDGNLFEGKLWNYLVERDLVSKCHSKLIANLQVIHDDYSPEEWPEKLQQFADKYKLDNSILN